MTINIIHALLFSNFKMSCISIALHKVHYHCVQEWHVSELKHWMYDAMGSVTSDLEDLKTVLSSAYSGEDKYTGMI